MNREPVADIWHVKVSWLVIGLAWFFCAKQCLYLTALWSWVSDAIIVQTRTHDLRLVEYWVFLKELVHQKQHLPVTLSLLYFMLTKKFTELNSIFAINRSHALTSSSRHLWGKTTAKQLKIQSYVRAARRDNQWATLVWPLAEGALLRWRHEHT